MQHLIHHLAKNLMQPKNWTLTVHDNGKSPVTSIVITYDNEFMFVANKDSTLRQFSLKYKCLVKKYNLPGNHGQINTLH